MIGEEETVEDKTDVVEEKAEEAAGEAPPAEGQEDAPSEAAAEEAELAARDEAAEESEGRELAFAQAPVVRLMKEEIDNDKMIRSRVKTGMNKWLEKLCRKVSAKMNESEYTMVVLDDFNTAIEPYEMVDDVEAERKRIVATLEKIKMDCDSLIRDVERKFITPDDTKIGTEGE